MFNFTYLLYVCSLSFSVCLSVCLSLTVCLSLPPSPSLSLSPSLPPLSPSPSLSPHTFYQSFYKIDETTVYLAYYYEVLHYVSTQ